jgi:serine/threonine-protein kinase
MLDPELRIRTARELAERVHRYLDGDRDLAQRGKLARDHLELAKAAPDDEDGRRTAMREAGQALALDPTLAPAAELIGRLMLEPPKQLPAEVQTEIAHTDRVTSRRFVKNALAAHISTLTLVPIMWFIGVHDLFYMPAFATLATLGAVLALIDLRLDRDMPWVHNAVVFASVALMARGFTPFLIAPAAVAVNAVAFAFHPRGKDRRHFVTFLALSLLAILGVWVCELVGLTSPTMAFAGGTITVTSPIEGADAIPLEWVLAAYVTIGTVNASVLAFRTARVTRKVREHAHVQAWQVRQLSPLDQKGRE